MILTLIYSIMGIDSTNGRELRIGFLELIVSHIAYK